jgi:hypothetical protein
MAMDHRASFAKTLFDVEDEDPDPAQVAAMKSAKQLIFQGLQAAQPAVTCGRTGLYRLRIRRFRGPAGSIRRAPGR